jgi:hypothetical protein
MYARPRVTVRFECIMHALKNPCQLIKQHAARPLLQLACLSILQLTDHPADSDLRSSLCAPRDPNRAPLQPVPSDRPGVHSVAAHSAR